MNDFNVTPPLCFGGHFNETLKTKFVKRTSGRSNVSGLLWQLFTNYRIFIFKYNELES